MTTLHKALEVLNGLLKAHTSSHSIEVITIETEEMFFKFKYVDEHIYFNTIMELISYFHSNNVYVAGSMENIYVRFAKKHNMEIQPRLDKMKAIIDALKKSGNNNPFVEKSMSVLPKLVSLDLQ